MAPLFPPKHNSLASPVDLLKNVVQDAMQELKDAAPGSVRASVVVGFFTLDLCPLSTPVADPPREEQPDLSRVGREAITWHSSGRDEAHLPFNQYYWPVPQPRSSNTHLMMSSSNTPLLFDGANPSTSMDWLPTYPSSVVR